VQLSIVELGRAARAHGTDSAQSRRTQETIARRNSDQRTRWVTRVTLSARTLPGFLSSCTRSKATLSPSLRKDVVHLLHTKILRPPLSGAIKPKPRP
jgi:hypothetical protein